MFFIFNLILKFNYFSTFIACFIISKLQVWCSLHQAWHFSAHSFSLYSNPHSGHLYNTLLASLCLCPLIIQICKIGQSRIINQSQELLSPLEKEKKPITKIIGAKQHKAISKRWFFLIFCQKVSDIFNLVAATADWTYLLVF